MSFITYSTLGHTLMKLTSDSGSCAAAFSLQELWVVGTPVKVASPQEGEVWEQCCGPSSLRQVTPGALLTRPLPASSADSSASSLIITLTTGPLLPTTLRETKSEADKARDMGAKVYCLGVKDYKKDQLHDIVERKDQMYGIDEFKSLEKLVTSLVENSCMEVMAGDTYFVCLGGKSQSHISIQKCVSVCV
ncbi:hypothetical protein E2I00_019380 [Balaenoptera physalus]|uniref:VWFA domain-containing protein n=1 Tax=Balaenoptera physalus TaxID=9770 RepID=A0A643AUT4_BALPH|nr:hypothetical protein E2I00_019380 [Balaenoptera physalus]